MGSPNPEVPIRLTPITGRVSRAKKGVPVHTCEMCNPPKVWAKFSRHFTVNTDIADKFIRLLRGLSTLG